MILTALHNRYEIRVVECAFSSILCLAWYYYTEVNGSLHTPADLSPEKKPTRSGHTDV
jgi:hypothetical protein